MLSANCLHQSSYQEQFQALERLLVASRPLWQVQAFEAKALPWQALFPALAKAVWEIHDDGLDQLDSDSEALHWRLRPALEADLAAQGLTWSLDLLSEIVQGLPLHQERTSLKLDETELAHFSAHIKGRKWQQIVDFASCLEAIPEKEQEAVQERAQESRELLEWCAGKGHLGRLLAKNFGHKVTSLEWQQNLCDAGQAFAQRWQLPQSFVCGDALAPETQALLEGKQQAVALHACGELHMALLRGVAQQATQKVAVAPCCYHLIQDKHYSPLSKLANGSELILTRHDLQLPLQRSVIANQQAQTLRLQEVAWRLGFDSLQRDVTGRNHYLPIPAIKQSQLRGSFTEFCLWAAEQKQVDLPDVWEADEYLQAGIHRQRLTRRIDLVAHLFREALEYWLLLDRVCFLQESGYQVKLGAFCDSQTTPRNALILADKKATGCE